MKRYIATAALLAVTFAAGKSCQAPQDRDAIVRTDTVRLTNAGYEGRLAALVIERDGLRARLEGVTERMPETVYVTDTLRIVDTAVNLPTIDQRGRLTFELLSRADSMDTRGTLYAPRLITRVDVSDCDRGLQIAEDGTVVCRPAKFGHAYLTATLSRSPQLGLAWRKSYRSPWEFGASYDGVRWDLSVRRSLQLW